jgi:hypothetical protein
MSVRFTWWRDPDAAVVFYFDTDVTAGVGRGPDDESAARATRVAVQGGVGGQLGGAEDHVVGCGAVGQ